MGTLSFALAAAAAAATAASPLHTALKAGGGTMCFARSYDDAWLAKHTGQTLREARFLVTTSRTSGRPMLRLKVAGNGAPIYGYGECAWHDGDLNRGGQNDILDVTFKPTTGVGCHLYTDVDGYSAEEGGDFPVEWVDGGQALQAHLPDSLAGWRSLHVSRKAAFHPLGPADRIIRLARAPAAECDELLKRFAPGAEMDDI